MTVMTVNRLPDVQRTTVQGLRARHPDLRVVGLMRSGYVIVTYRTSSGAPVTLTIGPDGAARFA